MKIYYQCYYHYHYYYYHYYYIISIIIISISIIIIISSSSNIIITFLIIHIALNGVFLREGLRKSIRHRQKKSIFPTPEKKFNQFSTFFWKTSEKKIQIFITAQFRSVEFIFVACHVCTCVEITFFFGEINKDLIEN